LPDLETLKIRLQKISSTPRNKNPKKMVLEEVE
jgi:hypothetical protein